MQPARTTTIAEQRQHLSRDGLLLLRQLVSATRAHRPLTKPASVEEDRWAGAIIDIEEAGFELDYRGEGAYCVRLIENEAALAAKPTPLETSIEKLESRLSEIGAIDPHETEWAYATGRALEQALLTLTYLTHELDRLHRELAHTRLALVEQRVSPTIAKDDVYEVQPDGDTHYIVKNGHRIGQSGDAEAAAAYVASKQPPTLRAWAAGIEQYDEREQLRWSSTEIVYAVDEHQAWSRLNAEYPLEAGYAINGMREQQDDTPPSRPVLAAQPDEPHQAPHHETGTPPFEKADVGPDELEPAKAQPAATVADSNDIGSGW